MLSPAKNGSKPETAQLSIKCMESIYFAILIQGNLYSHEKANFLLHTIIWVATTDMGFLDSSAGKNFPAMQETLIHSWVGKSPWRRDRLPTPVFWPGEFHGLNSWSQRVGHDWATFTFFHLRYNDDWMKPDTRTTITWFHLCDAKEQTKLISYGRKQNSGYFLVEGGVSGG